MSKRYFFTLLLCSFTLAPLFSWGQRWKYVRQEVFVAAGVGNVLSDLGGADKIGTNFLADFEPGMTRPAFGAGYRYRVHEYASVKGMLTYGILAGNDNTTNDVYRQNRNLHFRTNIVELSATAELYFLKEQTGGIYRLRGVRSRGSFNLAAYGFAGVSGFWFNPMGRRDGKWHGLRALGTEGQGLEGGPKQYSAFSFSIPFGLGCKYTINKNWGVGLEYGLRKTFTDYLDDVSGNYFDNNTLRTERGDIAADLADPSLGNRGDNGDIGDNIFVTQAGQQRGDPGDKDAYMFVVVTLNYKFLKGKTNRPKF